MGKMNGPLFLHDISLVKMECKKRTNDQGEYWVRTFYFTKADGEYLKVCAFSEETPIKLENEEDQTDA